MNDAATSSHEACIQHDCTEQDDEESNGNQCCCAPIKNISHRKGNVRRIKTNNSRTSRTLSKPHDVARKMHTDVQRQVQPSEAAAQPNSVSTRNSRASASASAGCYPKCKLPRVCKKRIPSLNNYMRKETACVLEYPMWVVPIDTVLAMKSVEPHQILRQRGDLVVQHLSDTSKSAVVFISHQWLSTRHPDPDGKQLKVLQEALQRLLSGQEVRSTGVTSMLYQKDEVDRSWGTTLKNARIWYDYFSIPQMTHDPSCRDDLMRAVRSIPAYVEMSTHTFVLSPPIAHHDFVDPTTNAPLICDYYTWLERGWCLVEKMAQFLKVNSNYVVVIRSGKHIEFQDILDAVARKVGDANFACCSCNHEEEVWVDAEDDSKKDGRKDTQRHRRKRQVLKKIPFACDKVKVYQLMELLIRRRLFYEFRDPRGEIHIYRLLRSLRFFLLANLPHPQDYDPYEEERTLDDFLRSYDFTVDDVAHVPRNRHLKGWTPLRFAALSSNARVVRELIAMRADVNAPFAANDPRWGIIKGCNILCHAAMYCIGTHGQECLSLLLDAKAHVQSGGLDVVNTPCVMPRPCIVRNSDEDTRQQVRREPSWGAEWALKNVAGKLLDLNVRSWAFSEANCVLTACARSGDVQFMKLLASHGADFTLRFEHQADAFVVACSTCPSSSIEMPQFCYELLRSKNVEVDLNRRLLLPFYRYWGFYALILFGNHRARLKSIMLWHGATALIAAAREGKCRVVAWLLEKQADPDIVTMNGDTALTMARRYGFYNVVKVLLDHKKLPPLTDDEV